MPDPDLFVLMARGTLEEIEAVARARPRFRRQVQEISRSFAVNRISPDYAMVEKLKKLKRQLEERQLEEEDKQLTKKPRRPS